MPGALPEKKKIAMEWLAMPWAVRFEKNLPLEKGKFITYLGIGSTTFKSWETEFYGGEKVRIYNNAHPLGDKEEVPEEVEYDSEAWLKSRTEDADKALMKSCAAGNAQSLKLFNQLINRLVEKQEVTLGLTADEIAHRNLEAERQLREGGFGMEKMSDKRALLSGDVRKDKRP